MAKPTEEEMFSYLAANGYPPHIAAGLIGNLKQESSYNPYRAVKNKEGGGGLAQWRGSRMRDLETFAKDNRRDIDDWKTQLDFVTHELSGKERRAFEKINQAKTPEEAALAFSQHYERPNRNYANDANRVAAARNVFSSLGNYLVKSAYGADKPEGPGVMQPPKRSFADMLAEEEGAVAPAPSTPAAPAKRTFADMIAEEEGLNTHPDDARALPDKGVPTLGERITQGLSDLGEGVVNAVKGASYAGHKAGYGAEQLMGLTTPEDDARMKRLDLWRQQQADSTGAAIGEGIGTGLALAGPALAAGPAGAPLAVGLMSGLTTPGGARERLQSAATNAGLEWMGGQVGNAIQGPYRNQITPEAQALYAEAKRNGMPLDMSIGQATGGKIESKMTSAPLGLGEAIMDMRNRAEQQGIDLLRSRAEVPDLGVGFFPQSVPEPLSVAGRAATNKNLLDSYDDAFRKTLGDGKSVLPQTDVDKIAGAARNREYTVAPGMRTEVANQFKALVDKYKDPVSGEIKDADLFRLSTELKSARSGVKGAEGQGLRAIYEDMIDQVENTLESRIGAANKDDLRRLRQSWATTRLIEDATERARGGPATAGAYARAADKGLSRTAKFAGQGENQQLARTLDQVFSKTPNSYSADRGALLYNLDQLGTDPMAVARRTALAQAQKLLYANKYFHRGALGRFGFQQALPWQRIGQAAATGFGPSLQSLFEEGN